MPSRGPTSRRSVLESASYTRQRSSRDLFRYIDNEVRYRLFQMARARLDRERKQQEAETNALSDEVKSHIDMIDEYQRKVQERSYKPLTNERLLAGQSQRKTPTALEQENKGMIGNQANQVKDDIDFETILLKQIHDAVLRNERLAQERETERRILADRYHRDIAIEWLSLIRQSLKRSDKRLGGSPAGQAGTHFTAMESQSTQCQSARSLDMPAPSHVPNFTDRPCCSCLLRES
ncbi:uncharacterized protein [Ptychodera flava]|uniref:uncharacterized protein n=1 Tax=Ptychodera flava TaxID=63121 RepID=UPI00396A3C5A